MQLDNIVILGGSGGIGKEIIELLIQSQIHVINIDKKTTNIASEHYDEILVELTSENIDEVCKQLFDKFNYIDGFISTIGYYGVTTLDTFSIDNYKKTLTTNVSIPTIFSIQLVKEMKKRNKGKIVFISSAAAYVGSRDISYSISKSAILGLIKGLSKNLNNTNIYIYGIAPGIVQTHMSKKMSSERQNDTILKTINKRMCSPLEVAKLVCFLLKEDEGYMNGSIIHINNGLYLN